MKLSLSYIKIQNTTHLSNCLFWSVFLIACSLLCRCHIKPASSFLLQCWFFFFNKSNSSFKIVARRQSSECPNSNYRVWWWNSSGRGCNQTFFRVRLRAHFFVRVNIPSWWSPRWPSRTYSKTKEAWLAGIFRQDTMHWFAKQSSRGMWICLVWFAENSIPSVTNASQRYARLKVLCNLILVFFWFYCFSCIPVENFYLKTTVHPALNNFDTLKKNKI